MNEITLAIPFYNTSHYFKEAVELALTNDFVKEIVVNDDGSTEDEWKKLNDIVDTLNTSKIKLFRNEVNLGGFRNNILPLKTQLVNGFIFWIVIIILQKQL